MIECPIPQDILKYKTKFVANFSVRETICLGLGSICSLGSFFTFLKEIDILWRIPVAALFALPFLIVGFVPLLGCPFEKVIISILFDNFICPMKRKKEIRHPELEKFEATPKWLTEVELQEESSQGEKRKKEKKQKSEKIRIKASKEYKAIR